MKAEQLKITSRATFVFFTFVITQLSLFYGISIACASPSELEIQALIGGFNASDVSVKADSLKSLVEIGEPSVEPLIQALGAENSEIRENAAIALGKIKDKRAVNPLIELLIDEEWEVEKATTDALILIGIPAMEPLIEILQDENEDVFLQMKAVQVLAGIGDERAVQPMIQALKENPELQADLGYHLGFMGEPAVEPLIEALENNDPKVRVRAAEALGRIGDKRAIGPLTEALNDEDERVRLFAKMGIEKIEAQKKNTLIATYGVEREFYIEDEARAWFDQLHTICELSRDDMELYFYPEGPVISYGCSIENCIAVGILEGSKVNNSTLDGIYSIFDQAGKEIEVNNVPVVFNFEGFVQEDEGTVQEAIEDIEKAEEPEGAEKTNENEKTDETEESGKNPRVPVNAPGLGTIFTLTGILISALIVNRR